VKETVLRYMTDQGDGTGDISYVGDYSITPKTLYLNPAGAGSGSIIQIHRMVVSVEDASMTPETYGTLPALDNGVQFKVVRGGVDQNIFPGIAIKTNADWGGVCFDVDTKDWGSGTPTNDVLVVRWTFAKSGAPIRLHPGDEFQVILSDDFTGLAQQHFHVQGIDEGKRS